MRIASNDGRSRVAEPISRLRDDVASIKENVACLATESVGTVTDAAKDAVNMVGDTARDLAEKAKGSVTDAHDRLGYIAAERPVTTILAAAAAGAALVTILRWLGRR